MLALLTMAHNRLARLEEEDGQGLTEYALILVLVAIVVIAALVVLGDDISSVISRVASRL